MYDDGLKLKDIFKKKSFLIFSTVLILTIALSAWLNLRKGIYIGNDFLYHVNDNYYKSNHNSLKITKEGSNYRYKIVIDGNKQTAIVKWTDTPPSGKVLIVIGNGSVIEGDRTFKGYVGKDGQLKDEQGSPIYDSTAITPSSLNKTYFPITNEELAQILCDLSYNIKTETRGSIFYILLYSLLYIFCIFNYYFPERFYFFINNWFFEKPRLSDAGKTISKIICVIAMIISLVFMIAPFK